MDNCISEQDLSLIREGLDLFYGQGDFKKSEAIFNELQQRYGRNEQYLNAFLPMLAYADRSALEKVLSACDNEIDGAVVARIKLRIDDNDYSGAKELIDSMLNRHRQSDWIYYLKTILCMKRFCVSGEVRYYDDAWDSLFNLKFDGRDDESKLGNSLYRRAYVLLSRISLFLVSKEESSLEKISFSESFCEKNNIYFHFAGKRFIDFPEIRCLFGKNVGISIEHIKSKCDVLIERGYLNAICLCGKLYYQSRSNTDDLEKAIDYFDSAVSKGDVEAIFHLALANSNKNKESGKTASKRNIGKFHSMNKVPKAFKPEGMSAGYLYLFSDTSGSNDEIRFVWEAVDKIRQSAENGFAKGMMFLGIYCLYEEKNASEALKWMNKAACLDDSDAMCWLGDFYFEGRNGIEKNDQTAFGWYLKSSQLGNKRARYELANMYYDGIGTDKDAGKAIELYSKNAEEGHCDSMVLLGDIFSKGEFENVEKSSEWYEKAAKTGSADGMFQVAMSYYYGRRVERDVAKAAEWLEKSSSKGSSEAKRWLGNIKLYEGKDSEALSLYNDSAKCGNTEAMVDAGVCYFYGWGVEKNVVEAINLYRKAADAGNANAMNLLGIAYGFTGSASDEKGDVFKSILDVSKMKAFGIASDLPNNATFIRLKGTHIKSGNVHQDLAEAAELFKKSADAGSERGAFYSALCYEFGIGVEKNVCDALLMYWEATTSGNSYAMNRLGLIYEKGEYVDKDGKEAIEWFRKASRNGFAWGMYNLAKMLLKESEKEENRKEGIEWLNKAAEKGNLKAIEELIAMHEIGEMKETGSQDAAFWRKRLDEANEKHDMQRACNQDVDKYFYL